MEFRLIQKSVKRKTEVKDEELTIVISNNDYYKKVLIDLIQFVFHLRKSFLRLHRVAEKSFTLF